MKKGFTFLLLLFIVIVLGFFVVQQYFSYVGPELARKASFEADLTKLEVDKERLLLLNKAVEERLRGQTTTNGYYYGWIVFLLAMPSIILFVMWHNYDKRKESWARPVQGMFALQTHKANGITWQVDPNKTFTSAIGVADSGEIGELPVTTDIGPDRQLDYNKNVQKTRTAIAVTGDGQGFKYAATGKFLAGGYDKQEKILQSSDGKNYEEVLQTDFEIMQLADAWAISEKHSWILGQSKIDGKICKIDITRSVHLAIIGAPGVGKTASTGLLVASYAVSDGFIVLCLDAKDGMDWTEYNEFFEVQETNENIFHLQFAEIAKEHNRRSAILKENKWKSIDESGGQIRHVLVILEEFGYLMQKIAMTDQQLYKKLLTAVTNLMKVSRATGIHFCIIDQTLADCPNEIKAIIKTYIAYKLNGGIGNAVKLYYLDKLAETGEFCWSDSPDNKFQAWHTALDFKKLRLVKKDWHILPEFTEIEPSGVVTEFSSKKLMEKAEQPTEDELSFEDKVLLTYTSTNSLNKTCEEIFGKGKKGAFYINKIKPILIKAGVYNEQK
ncbi:MAG: hypothetical protein EKK57_07635 [Proteobacteria bacterium]|nr:MAG: hypothetical protein EKK57_07635 [Pseudomonadota bacterium]